MSNAKDLIKAVVCITTAYSEDLKEFEDMKRRLRRAERKIGDLSVELQHYAKLAHNFESRMERSILPKDRFYQITKSWLNSVVYNMYIPIRDAAITTLCGSSIQILSGDKQFDSRGHRAKYCVYTITDHTRGLILDYGFDDIFGHMMIFLVIH